MHLNTPSDFLVMSVKSKVKLFEFDILLKTKPT